MKAKKTRAMGWPCLQGEMIVFYSLPYRLPYTAKQLERYLERVGE